MAVLLALACTGEVRVPPKTEAPGDGPHAVDCEAGTRPPRRVRRLTRAELETSASAVTGTSAALAADLPPDAVALGFDTLAEHLTVGPLFAEQLMTAAERLSAGIAAQPARWGGCTDVGATCRDTFIATLGALAFRRPVTAPEVQEYGQLFELAKGDGFGAAAEYVAGAMLQSPFFVYRTELGRPAATGTSWELTGPELAQALSFFMTGGPPDDVLRALSAQGSLADPAVRRAEATRLLVTAAGQRQQGDFVEKWLGLDVIGIVQKAGPHAAAFDATVRDAMRAEARTLHHGAMSLGYSALMSPQASAASPSLLAYYADAAPRGLLTLGALMSVYGKTEGSAPVQRGEVIRERVLCEELPPPPPGVDAQPPAPVPGTTARQRYAAHEAQASCKVCHERIDLIGFGLEHYDGFGRWRATEAGVTIDSSGTVVDLDGADAPFDGAAGLAGLLSASTQARDCYARQWVRFGLGSTADHDGFRCVSREAEAALSSGSVPLGEALFAVVAAPGFALREAPAVAPVLPSEPPFMVAPADAGTGMPPVGVGGLTVTRRSNSDWPTGFCEDVTVTNTTAQPVDWQVELAVSGTVTQSWNSSYSVTAQGVVFVGAAWNRTVGPGASAAFGYCANK
ncbi:MAG: DUF1588 domain-containing protein [Myxococcaceae bacterium]|nr:DUF1588 domain-containing protein [Myxococcaceae bacterium]